jgi:hypothetical protein
MLPIRWPGRRRAFRAHDYLGVQDAGGVATSHRTERLADDQIDASLESNGGRVIDANEDSGARAQRQL